MYGGNVSDRYILEAEFIDKVEPGDAIMVDMGFNVKDLMLQRGAKLHIPPFTRRKEDGKGKMLTQSEIRKTKSIPSLRIHVERSIKRLKTFKAFSNRVDTNLWPLMDNIVVIVPPLVRSE